MSVRVKWMGRERVQTTHEIYEFVRLNPPSHPKPCACMLCRGFKVNQEENA